MYIALYLKRVFSYPILMKLEFFATDFREILKHQISWKSIQLELRYSTRTNGRKQTDMTKLMHTFHNFANAP